MKLAVPRPRSLAARLALILFAGLVLAYGLSFASQFYERYQTAKHMMLDSLEQDVAISVAMLDRLTPAEREAWLPRLERRTYRYRLDPASRWRWPTRRLPRTPSNAPSTVNIR